MTLKVTLGEIVQSQQSLTALGAIKNMPQSTLFRVGRAIRKSKDELRQWAEQRRDIMIVSGKSDAHPQVPGEIWIDPAKVDAADIRALDQQIDALNKTEVEIECHPMKLSEFGEKAMAEITPNMLADLGWLITEE
jgi:hypothetical protein